MIGYIKARIGWTRHVAKLSVFQNMAEFKTYVRYVQPREFLRFEAYSEEKRREFQIVCQQIGLSPSGKAFLDIGPGYGDALDICREQQARAIDFVEIEPFFYTYNRLKAIGQAYRLNHLFQLEKVESKKYDLIWCKGSIGADAFATRRPWRGGRFLDLKRWLASVHRAASRDATIVICPHWRNDGSRRAIENLRSNSFATTMFEHGYDALENIEGHHTQPGYPITFLRQRSV
jgi:hypothetical protein